MKDPSNVLLQLAGTSAENSEDNSSSSFLNPAILDRYMNGSDLEKTLFIPLDFLKCGHYQVVDLQFKRTSEITAECRFWNEGVLSVGVGAFGLLGNVISIWILNSPEMKSTSFNRLLMALAIIDCLFIVPGIIIYVSKVFYWHPQWYNHLFPVFLYPFSEIALCSSMYMTVAIAVERYIGLCRPFKRLASRPCSAKYYIIPVLLFSTLLNIPKFLEAENRVIGFDKATNSTVTRIKASDLRKNPTYITYYWLWTRLLATGIIPLVLLAFLNTKIYLAIRRSKQQLRSIAIRSALPILGKNVTDICIESSSRNVRRTTSSFEPIRRTFSRAPKEQVLRSQSTNATGVVLNRDTAPTTSGDMNLAPILFGVVIVFVSCNSLRLILNFYDFSVVDKIIDCERKGVGRFPPPWMVCSVSVSQFLLMANSSVNFLVYCFAGTKFRRTLARKLSGIWKKLFDTDSASASEAGEPRAAQQRLLLREVLVDPQSKIENVGGVC